MLKQEILNLLNDDHYIPMDYHEIGSVLMIENAELDLNEIYKTIVILENEHLIIRVKKDKLQSIERLNLAYGVLEVKRRGFGFVRTKDFDVFIKKDNLNGALNKDEVLVKLTYGKGADNREGYIYRVLNHGYDLIVGEVTIIKNKMYVKPDDSSLNMLLRITDKNSKGATDGHKVLCYITEVDKKNEIVYAAIKTIIGHVNDVGIDILSVVYKHGFDPSFTKSAIKEAKSFHEEDIKVGERYDLRNKLTITIDGADAKDLDDAISLEVNDSGNMELYVSIADVSHYVAEKSELNREAFARSTSVYLVDRVVPMLPPQLSNGICSLLPNADRLTQTCKMEFDKQGKVINYEIFESIINSNYRMTYDDVNLIIHNKKDQVITDYTEVFLMIRQMHELSLKIRDKRNKRGMLNFEVGEPKIIVDSKGNPLEIYLQSRDEAEKIIEDFMIIANETVAQHVYWMSLPFLYRTHDEPNPDKITDFLGYANLFGIKMKGKSEHVTSKDIQKLLDEIASKDNVLFLDKLLLRSMAKAKYEKENIGHFGLASKYYTHFTSPIRRYPDLIVHRLLRKYFFNKKQPDSHELKQIEERLDKIGEQTSRKERDAIAAEREVNDMKMAQYMFEHIGEEYIGRISSVTSFGFFVELENTIEGLVHISTLLDDHYNINSKFHMLVGERSNKQYKLGQEALIKVTSVDINGGNIDFSIVK